VNVSIITVDSLTGERLDGQWIYVDYYKESRNIYLSHKDSNIFTFALDFTEKQSYKIQISCHLYIPLEFDLTLAPDCTDTTIIVKLLYNFHPRTLPRFLFNKYEYLPDTTNWETEMICLDYFINHTLKEDKFVMVLNGCFSPDENDTNNVLAMKRIHYIRDLAIKMGADSNLIEIRLQEYKPYQFFYKEELTEFFKFKDVLTQEYLDKLPPTIRTVAEKYNRRVFITVNQP